MSRKINYKFLKKANKKIVFLALFILFSFSFSFAGMAFSIDVDELHERSYKNWQCYLGYDVFEDTVADIEHNMYEKITIDKSGIISSKNSLNHNDIEEALKMNYTIKYSVYTDFLPPTFLEDTNGNLVDSRYREKMLFLGEEYYVNDWDGDNLILEIAKGAERSLDNKAFGGDFTAGDGTYHFKVHRAIFSEDRVAGITVDVKKPDGTEVQVLAQRSLNAVVGNVEISLINLATGDNYVLADVIVYDLFTKIILRDREWFTDKGEWHMEIDRIPLGCLADLDSDGRYECDGIHPGNVPTDKDRNRFEDYERVDSKYSHEGMLQWVHLTLKQECPFECCTEFDYRDKFCPTGYDCEYPDHKCVKVKQNCPNSYICCSEDDKEYYSKKCGDGYVCKDNKCLKQKENCPFDCCESESDYADKPCLIGYQCENHKCVGDKQLCPYECCINEDDYFDKSCSSRYSCINNKCLIRENEEKDKVEDEYPGRISEDKISLEWIIIIISAILAAILIEILVLIKLEFAKHIKNIKSIQEKIIWFIGIFILFILIFTLTFLLIKFLVLSIT